MYFLVSFCRTHCVVCVCVWEWLPILTCVLLVSSFAIFTLSFSLTIFFSPLREHNVHNNNETLRQSDTQTQTMATSNNERRTTWNTTEAPRLVKFEFSSDVMVGMKVRAMCAVSEGDPPFQFGWRKDGLPIDTIQGINVEASTDYTILSIDSVELSHAGNYSCLVANEGARVGYSSTLRVNGTKRDTQYRQW